MDAVVLAGTLFKWELRLGQPRKAGELTLIPLFGGQRAPDYVVGAELIAAGKLTITELGTGSVPQLLATNRSNLPALLIDGEALEGARQDRILNASALLPAGQETTLPVSCVEAGRWGYEGTPDFDVSPQTAPAGLRMNTRAEVAAALRAGIGRSTNQSRVWRDVAVTQTLAGVASSPTRAMRDSFTSSGDRLARVLDAAPEPEERQTGVIACFGERVAALDTFDRPETLATLWSRLLRGYAMGTLVAMVDPAEGDPPVDSIEAFVRDVGRANATAHPGIGLGGNVVMTGREMVGEALVWEQGVVHASAFAVPDAPSTSPGASGLRSGIRRPYRFGFRG
jgi:hypothetical protein